MTRPIYTGHCLIGEGLKVKVFTPAQKQSAELRLAEIVNTVHHWSALPSISAEKSRLKDIIAS